MQPRSPNLWAAALSIALLPACVPADEPTRPPLAQQSCARDYADDAPVRADGSGLHITEVVSDNDGINVDALGETDDWFELSNDGSAPIALAKYLVTDSGGK